MFFTSCFPTVIRRGTSGYYFSVPLSQTQPMEERMLPESRLLSFIDNKEGYAVHFLEGQKLIHDLALLHEFSPQGFAWFRDCVLSVQPMISLLKRGEGFGFFLTGDKPQFRLNFETGFHGQMRSMLTPRNFSHPPAEVHGSCRLVKILPGKESTPFQSIIEVKGLTLPKIINSVLEKSFQMQSEVLISEVSDQSVIFTRLPEDASGNTAPLSAREYRLRMTASLRELFAAGHTGDKPIVESLTELGLKYLTAREVRFRCSCSRERVTSVMKQLIQSGQLTLKEDEESLETACEYCNKPYSITRKELLEQ